MTKESERKQVRRDESDATVREGSRQAALEKERVIDAAAKAEREAAQGATSPAAELTFRERFMKFWRGNDPYEGSKS